MSIVKEAQLWVDTHVKWLDNESIASLRDSAWIMERWLQRAFKAGVIWERRRLRASACDPNCQGCKRG